VREDTWRCLRLLKSSGQSILLMEKSLDALLGLADRHYVLEKGRVVWSGPLPDAASAAPIKTRYLGL
jgi:branched-chain amino acid transport system ATP-binding protein